MLLLLALLAGCGASSAPNAGSSYDRAAQATPPPAATYAPGYGSATSSDTAESVADPTSGSVGTPQDQKLVYTVNLSIETLDYDKAVSAIDALCAQYGGYVQSSSVSGNGINSSALRWASYTLRIPAGQLDAFQTACATVGNITSASRDTQNQTAQYVDLQARLDSLQTEEARLLELLKQAANLDDVIALNDRLSDVQYQIESIQTQLRGIDSQVAYSTVNISLNEVVKASEPAAVPRTFGERVSAAFASAKNSFVSAMSGLGVFLFGTLPMWLLTIILVLLPFAVIALIVILIVRAGRRHRRNRRAAITPPQQQYAPPQQNTPPQQQYAPSQTSNRENRT